MAPPNGCPLHALKWMPPDLFFLHRIQVSKPAMHLKGWTRWSPFPCREPAPACDRAPDTARLVARRPEQLRCALALAEVVITQIRDHLQQRLPQIFNTDLWRKSGHYDNYAENMFFIDIDETEYGVKPMNCPAAATAHRIVLTTPSIVTI